MQGPGGLDHNDVGVVEPVRRPAPFVGAYVAGLLVGEIALGWYTSSLNEWLLLPEVLVMGTGTLLAVGWGIYARRHPGLGIMAVSTTIVLSIVVSLLVYCFALPLKMLHSSSLAVRSAEALISKLDGTVGGRTCSSEGRYLQPVASIIQATSACARRPTVAVVSYRHGDSFLYYGPSGPRSGRDVTFWPDSCVRHLYGPWWALHTYNPDSSAQGGGPACPFGYSFIGGP